MSPFLKLALFHIPPIPPPSSRPAWRLYPTPQEEEAHLRDVRNRAERKAKKAGKAFEKEIKKEAKEARKTQKKADTSPFDTAKEARRQKLSEKARRKCPPGHKIVWIQRKEGKDASYRVFAGDMDEEEVMRVVVMEMAGRKRRGRGREGSFEVRIEEVEKEEEEEQQGWWSG